MVAVVLVATFGTAAALTALCVPLVIRLCFARGWLAYPGPRHSHRVATPMLGGLAILVGILSALFLSFSLESLSPLLQRTSYEHMRLALLVVGMVVVAGVSVIDDIRELSPWVRLGCHFAAALVVVGPYLWEQTLYPNLVGELTEAHGIILTAFNFPFIGQIHLHDFNPWLAIGATLFWVVGLQNMLNWVDGLDGLAAGITLIASLILAIHAIRLGQWTIALLPLALAGACAGFLPFNMHPARLFMGDVGAMTLGYLLAVSAIIGGAKLATALLVLGVPVIDMAWLIFRRAFRGDSVAQPGRDHLHTRLIDSGLSQQRVVLLYYVVSLSFGGVALVNGMTPIAKLGALMLLGGMVLLFLLKHQD